MSEPVTSVAIAELMASSGVGWGTSGARGQAVDMTDRVCYAYTAGFLQHLEALGEAAPGTRVALGGDLRPSTGRITAAVARAILDRRCVPVFCGSVPSPALALYGIEQGIPSVMVTGSHIPEDRNGMKFNRAAGEILKEDEAAVRNQVVGVPGEIFDGCGMLRPGEAGGLPAPIPDAAERYLRRYLAAFPEGCLEGMRIGLYEHSAVGRDLLHRLLTGLGARVTRLGRTDGFVPVDTEAIREEDAAAAREWAAEGRYDAIVSTDGDSDRPLVSDEEGRWLRGDVAGILAARFLGAEVVVVPVSCNTALERCGAFRHVRRTRIGSPYVIAGMQGARADGRVVVGYEANGGFLTASPVAVEGTALPPLPTRDSAVVILSILRLAARENRPISRLLADLPQRFTASDRLQEFPTERSRRWLRHLTPAGPLDTWQSFGQAFGGLLGPTLEADTTDGLRVTLSSGEVVHLRPSGNAPEFRCYTEADSEVRARQLAGLCLDVMERWRAEDPPPPP